MSARQAGTRWSVFKRSRVPALICGLGVAVEVYTLAFRTTTRVAANGAPHVLVKELEARVPITQTFEMRSDGLKGIRIRLASSVRSDIALDWLLSEQQHQPPAIVPLHGKRLQLRNVSGERRADLLFPAIAHSIGKTYTLQIRASDVRLLDPGSSPGPATDGPALVASAYDALPGAILAVDGQVRSGDLVFDTVALGDTMLGRFLLTTERGPENSSHYVWLAGAAIALHNIMLAAFVMHFWPHTRTVPDETGNHGTV